MPHRFEKEFIMPADFSFKSVQSFLMGKQESGLSRKTEADRVVRDWPQKLNSIMDNHRDPIEIKDTARDLHRFALFLWISLVTSIAVCLHSPFSSTLLRLWSRTRPPEPRVDAFSTPPADCIPRSGRKAWRTTYAGAPPSLLALGIFAEVRLVFGTAAADPLEAGEPCEVEGGTDLDLLA
jgi:hypothetical protein